MALSTAKKQQIKEVSSKKKAKINYSNDNFNNDINDDNDNNQQTDDENSAKSTSDDDDIGNAGWADSIAKVLNTTKPKSKKTLVLSRAKKNKPGDIAVADTAADAKKKKTYDFEVEGEVAEDEKPTKELIKKETHIKRNKKLQIRVRPSWQDIERERTLRKIATRGVVQLFNAVRIQQKDLEQQLDEAGPLESRKDAVLNSINKRKFLDVLMSGKRAKSQTVDNAVKYETKQESTDESDEEVNGHQKKKKKNEWNVLRSDFMTNKKIKHWDESDDDSDAASQDKTNDGDNDVNDDDE